MTLTILLLVISLAMVVFGADKLVDGASVIARKAGISEFVIGLTIVGFGTSCPELVVSTTGALEGLSDIALGNILGSNIFNTLLILGLTALLSPIGISKENKKRDIPISIFACFLICALILHGTISRLWGIIFIVLFGFYLYSCFKFDKVQEESAPDKSMKLPLAIFWTVAGLAMLIFGGKGFVDQSVKLAHMFGLSEKFIAITLLAGGTSLPELVTCIVASAKQKDQLALGNILGSNVFNILLILGISATIKPIDCGAMTIVDIAVLALSSIVVFTASFFGKKDEIDRLDGVILLFMEAAYTTYLFLTV